MSTTKSEPKSRKGIGGPKTAEGKKRVSLNAMKHGLDAKSKQAQMAVEELVGVTLNEVLDNMRELYQPADAIEEILVQRVARCAWRMLMAQAMEDNYLERRYNLTVGSGYQKLLRNERLIDVQFHRAIAALARKQAERKRVEAKETTVTVPSPTENRQPLTDNLNRQNKLNEAPTPRSTHAQSEPEFVPQISCNSVSETEDCRPSTVDLRATHSGGRQRFSKSPTSAVARHSTVSAAP